MGAALNGIIFDDLECPLTWVSRSLYTYKSNISQMVRVFNCTKHSCILLGALPKPCKKLGSSLIFFAKSAGRCFTPVIEIKPNTFSPH